MKNQVWNSYYEAGHHLYMSWGSNWDISMKEAVVRKIEIIKETPKKFKIRISVFSTFRQDPKLEVIEKLHNKEKVNISWVESFDNLLEKVEKHKQWVKDSDRIAEYKKKAILEEFEKLTEELLKTNFN